MVQEAPGQRILPLFYLQHPSHICLPSLQAFAPTIHSAWNTHCLLCLANLTSFSKTPQVSSPPENLTGQCLLHSVPTGVGKPLCMLPLTLFDSRTRTTQHTVIVSWPNSYQQIKHMLRRDPDRCIFLPPPSSRVCWHTKDTRLIRK